jgi:hypothetical protein
MFFFLTKKKYVKAPKNGNVRDFRTEKQENWHEILCQAKKLSNKALKV